MTWTNDELQFVKNSINTMTHTQIAEILGKTRNAVRNKCYLHGWVNKENEWKDWQVDLLKKEYENSNNNTDNSINLNDISKKIGKLKSNISRKAKIIGLDTNQNRNKISDGKRKPVKTAKYKTDEERAVASSIRLKEWHKNNEHPKGMLGKHHDKEYCKELSKRVSKYWNDVTPKELEQRKMASRMTKIENGTLNSSMRRSNPYSRARGGKRKDLNDVYFRSSWEANMARYYNFVGIKWLFEPKTFVFPNVTRGSVSYTPDFYLPDEDRWVEIKGWMDQKSKTKLRRFEKEYPEEYKKLEIITLAEYKKFSEYKRLIPNWEDVHV